MPVDIMVSSSANVIDLSSYGFDDYMIIIDYQDVKRKMQGDENFFKGVKYINPL